MIQLLLGFGIILLLIFPLEVIAVQRKCGFDDYGLFCNPDEDCVRDKWHCEEGTVLQGTKQL